MLIVCGSCLCVSGLAQSAATGFKKHVISNDFISEGVAVGDVNKDGKIDILAGPSWFESPGWKRHDIDTFKVYAVKTQYARSFLNHCMDINQDGWPDLIVMDFPGLSADWFENPGNKTGYWKKHRLYDYVGNESPAFEDVDGDGQDDIICADSKTNQMIWLQAPAKGDTAWKRFVVGKKNVQGTDIQGHGLGYGDLNSDGRKDIFTKDGWWEGPVDVKQNEWIFHPADIGEDCSQMQVLDVNADGLPDVVSASAHRYGIWWHPQYKDDEGNRAWDHYTLSFSTSQTHATGMADLNGDGNKEVLVRGKNFQVCSGVGNCGFWVFERTGSKLKLLLSASDYADISDLGDQVLKSQTNGYSDLLLMGHFSVSNTGLYTYKFDGVKYVEARCRYEVPNYKTPEEHDGEIITCKEFERRLRN